MHNQRNQRNAESFAHGRMLNRALTWVIVGGVVFAAASAFAAPVAAMFQHVADAMRVI